ncbi:MAG: threonine/serine exporter [Bacteroidales bacterium]|nr:threonine/serine exporter [Bacteroidales bacterium]
MIVDAVLQALPHLGHQALFGAIAAAGFGVLFNFGLAMLIWCGAAGALALAVRTFGQDLGWSLEAASFAAALTTSCGAILVRRWLGAASAGVALAGCIPMVPGAFFGHALLGFFAVTTFQPNDAITAVVDAMQYMLRVCFTLGAIGAGLAIPTHLIRNPDY